MFQLYTRRIGFKGQWTRVNNVKIGVKKKFEWKRKKRYNKIKLTINCVRTITICKVFKYMCVL